MNTLPQVGKLFLSANGGVFEDVVACTYKIIMSRARARRRTMKHEIIGKMTLEEKASLTSGKDFWQTMDLSQYDIPSLFCADGPSGLRKQRAAADHLGLNPSYPATCFPSSATMANSWNVDLVHQVGVALGKEAKSLNVNVLLAPGTNIKRNPKCGRNFEYFSEDPYLAGKMAGAYVSGVQSTGIACCLKHFACNNKENMRMVSDSIMDERALREIYLTAFEIAITEAHPKTIMSSYNKLNGTYANENMHLLREILRGEWGFPGVIITDWGGDNDRVDGLVAGNELEMPTTAGETNQDIVDAVNSGRIDESVLDEAVDRLLTLVDDVRDVDVQPFDHEAHNELAQRVSEDSAVLLRNDGTLPLADKTVAIIGDFARTSRYQGAGSSNVNPTKLESALDVAAEYFNVVGFEPGFKRFGKKSNGLANKAIKLAKKADVVLYYMGLDETSEAEGTDRTHTKIPQNQIDLLAKLSTLGKPIVVVLAAGSAVEMGWAEQYNVNAVLHGYLCGQAGARALMRILTGAVNPSGKLSESYPYAYEDNASAKYFDIPGKVVEYRESVFVGYRYYKTAGVKVQYPFGFGLSYTKFDYANIKVDGNTVTFDVTNSGAVDGAETSQLYVSKAQSDIFRPEEELKGFAKTFLKAGETKNVTITLDDKAYRYFNVVTNKWEVEGGDYEIRIGASSEDIRLTATVHQNGTGAPAPYDKAQLAKYYNADVANLTNEEFEVLLGRKVEYPVVVRRRALGYNDTIGEMKYCKGWFAHFAYGLLRLVYNCCKLFGNINLALMLNMGVFNQPFRGVYRMTNGAINKPMMDGVMVIVNGNFFKGLHIFLKENRKKNKAAKAKAKAAAQKNNTEA